MGKSKVQTKINKKLSEGRYEVIFKSLKVSSSKTSGAKLLIGMTTVGGGNQYRAKIPLNLMDDKKDLLKDIEIILSDGRVEYAPFFEYLISECIEKKFSMIIENYLDAAGKVRNCHFFDSIEVKPTKDSIDSIYQIPCVGSKAIKSYDDIW